MQFSNTTTKNGIVQLTERLCKLGDGGITNDTTLFLQITGDLNQAYKKVSMALLRVDKYWKWDDTNYTDFPTASINLVASQRDYTLPAAVSGGNASTLWKLNKVSVMGLDGKYRQLTLAAPDAYEDTNTGQPETYKLIGGSIRIIPLPVASAVTLTAGLQIEFQRSIIEYTTASTTVQPGFMDSYHDLLAYDASSTYLLPVNQELAINYSNIFENRLKLLQKDYSNRNDDAQYIITTYPINSK